MRLLIFCLSSVYHGFRVAPLIWQWQLVTKRSKIESIIIWRVVLSMVRWCQRRHLVSVTHVHRVETFHFFQHFLGLHRTLNRFHSTTTNLVFPAVDFQYTFLFLGFLEILKGCVMKIDRFLIVSIGIQLGLNTALSRDIIDLQIAERIWTEAITSKRIWEDLTNHWWCMNRYVRSICC